MKCIKSLLELGGGIYAMLSMASAIVLDLFISCMTLTKNPVHVRKVIL